MPYIPPMLRLGAGLEEALAPCSGVLLTGGEDVAPALYGEVTHPATGQVCEERDHVEMDCIAWAINHKKPVLGICRGIQVLNVYFKGTLFQDLPSQHRQDTVHPDSNRGSWLELRHKIHLEPGSIFHALLGADEMAVNSLHHQAVKEIGAGLKPVAWAEDGIVEGVELTNYPFCIAVQCHPEVLWQKLYPRWFNLFEAFIKTARDAPVK